ncbi:unnamed protein product [Rhizophagus irregularis]|nr:unnamed protein product [Rhizophagus irregularis]
MRLIFDKLENFYLMPPMEFKYQAQSLFQTTNMVVIDDINENIPPEFESITNGNYINDINVNKIKDITLHRDAITTKTNCLWQASFYFEKRIATIHLSKFNNVHNHQCDPITIELAFKNQCFPQAMLDKIDDYSVNRHLSAEQQYDLLLKEFPQQYIKKKKPI